MIHSTLRSDFSPPGSNEEVVNSPQSNNPPSNQSSTSSLSGYSPARYAHPDGKRYLPPLQKVECSSASKSMYPDYMTNNSLSPASKYQKLDSYPDDIPVLVKEPPSNYWSPASHESVSMVVDEDCDNNTLNKKIPKINTLHKSYQCMVCGDKASIEYFGVLSCDSCRGFFKRSIKNEKAYSCSLGKNCVLNKKTRNHCQGCRIAQCYKVGMNKTDVEVELAQERQKRQGKKKAVAAKNNYSDSEENPLSIDLSVIAAAELFVDPKIEEFANVKFDPIRQLCLAADKQLASLAEWAKRMPYFTELKLNDQVKLLQWNWAELLIGGFCYRSSAVSDGILLSTGLHLSRENLEKAGVGTLVNKLFSEVINKMQKLQIDITEWGCLRAIMLFAPDTKELVDIPVVENIRECYIATLCSYVNKTYPNNPQRLSQLLLRLAPLKAIALQVLEHLFFFKILGDVPIDTFLLEMLDTDNH